MRRPKAFPGQLEISFFEVPATPKEDAGSLDVGQAVRDCLAETLTLARTHGKDRFAIGAAVSRLTGREMTKNMLDRYTSHEEDKRFPLEALPAITRATGDFRLLELVAHACGCRVLRGEEALITEVGAALLLERSVKTRLTNLQKALPEGALERLIADALKRVGGAR